MISFEIKVTQLQSSSGDISFKTSVYSIIFRCAKTKIIKRETERKTHFMLDPAEFDVIVHFPLHTVNSYFH